MEEKNVINKIIVILILYFSTVVVSFIIGYQNGKSHSTNDNIPTPVEKYKLDTLYIKHDSLITKIKYIDSIKYDTIEKVYNLNDSASVKLFYELVTE